MRGLLPGACLLLAACSSGGSGGGFVDAGSGGASGFSGFGGNAGNAGSGGTAGNAGGAGAGSGGLAGGAGSGGAGGSGGGAGAGGSGGCASETLSAKPLDLAILLDRSASMQDASKWTNVSAQLGTFSSNHPAHIQLEASLEVFPVPPAVPPPTAACTNDTQCGAYGPCLPQPFSQCAGAFSTDSSCIASDYQTPELDFGTLPSASWSSKLTSIVADGGATTMTPALEGVHTVAQQRALASSGHHVAVVLLTDGEPTGCTVNTVNDVAAVAQTALSATPSVATHVIAVGITPATLQPIAAAGGTAQARDGGSSGQLVQAQLEAVVAEHACRLPKPSFTSFTLSLVQGASTTPLPAEPSASCAGMGHHDSGSALVLCTAACQSYLSSAAQIQASQICN